MAQNYGRNGADIPVSKGNRRNANTQRQPNPYKYEDLMRRENGEIEKNQPMPQQMQQGQAVRGRSDIYVNRDIPNSYSQNAYSQNGQPAYQAPKNQYNDYVNSYNQPNDVPFTKRNQPQEYSRGGGGGKPSKRKKKRGKFLKFLLCVVLFIGLAYVGVTGYLYSIFSSTDYVKTETKASSSSSLVSDKNVKNILLIGVDDRQGANRSRSDTMMLVSIDKNNKQIKMTSFMRDTYVEIPDNGWAKMNAACTYGGPELVMKTIEKNFGIDIDNYVLVDFSAFKDVVDALGGVEVEVEKREAEFINTTSRQKIDYGERVKLNGEEALVYVRIRYLDSDFMRTQRQRKVISAIIGQMKETNLFDLADVAKDVLGYIETDITPLELTFLAEGAVLSYMRYDMHQARVPFDGEYTSKTINGQSVLSIDIDKTSEMVQEFIFEKAQAEDEEE